MCVSFTRLLFFSISFYFNFVNHTVLYKFIIFLATSHIGIFQIRLCRNINISVLLSQDAEAVHPPAIAFVQPGRLQFPTMRGHVLAVLGEN